MSADTTADLGQKAADHLWMPYSSPGTQGIAHDQIRFIVRGEGCRVWDLHGSELLDGISALEAMILGHGDQETIDAITEQAQTLAFHDVFRFAAPVQAELAAELAAVAPGMRYAHFTPGGAEADEVAIKLARQFHALRGEPYRRKVITRQGAFHGVTLGAMGLDGRYFASRNDVYDGGPSWFRAAPVTTPDSSALGKAARHLPAVADIEATIRAEGPETVAAVVVDPMATAIAVAAPPDTYQQELRAVCDRYGVLLVCDEIITGMGRTGRLFATEFAAIEPDFITMSKGLSSGYVPIGACLVAGHIAKTFQDHGAVFRHGHTYAGHPLGAAAALSVLARVRRDRLWENAEARGARLMAGLRGLADRSSLVWDVRGRGLLVGIEIVADASTGEDFPDPVAAGNELRIRCRERGLAALILHPGNVLFLAPPLIVTEQEIDQMVAIVGESLQDMEVKR